MPDAQDASQEVFLKAFRYLHRFDSAKPLSPWLMRITVNVARDIGRRHSDRTDAPEPEAVDSVTPHSELAALEQKEILRRALDELPYKERSAIVLRDLEGLRTREVAEILQSSQSTVRAQIASARLKLRKLLKGIRP